MKASAVQNLAVVIAAMVISSAYIEFAAPHLSGVAAAAINILFLCLLGFALGLGLTGRILLKAALVVVIPVAHVLYFDPDPAKPGIERSVALVEYAVLVAGLVAGDALKRRRERAAPRPH